MKIGAERAEVLALQALAFLAEDEDLLLRFLALTGMDQAALRTAAGERGTLIAVLDFVLFDDALVLSFAERAGIRPEEVTHVRYVLSGPETDPV